MDAKTEWNGGTPTNIRLNQNRLIIQECRRTNNINAWIRELENFNEELYPFEDEKEQTNIDTRLKNIRDKIIDQTSRSNNSRTKRKLGIPLTIIDELNDIGKELMKVFNRSGFQTKNAEDATDAFN